MTIVFQAAKFDEAKIYQPPIDLWKRIHRIVEIVRIMMNKNELNQDLIQEEVTLLNDKEVVEWMDGIDDLKKKGVLKK